MIWAILVACHADPDDTSGAPSLRLVDGALAFESVEIGLDEPRVETVWVENAGTGLLFVDVPYFAEDGAFSVPSESVTLERMEAYGYDVTFDPQTPFLHEGWLVIESDDPLGPSRRVAVRGEAFAPVLEVSTSPIVLGTVSVGCGVLGQVEVRNEGNELLVVTPSLDGANPTELFLPGGGVPKEIEPGTSVTITIRYEPTDGDSDTATLTLESNDPLRPETTIDVTAAGSDLATRTDTFEMGPRKTDVVFVVDNSESMDTEQEELAQHIGAFVDGLEAGMVDYRIAVITTDHNSFDAPVVTDAIDARSLDEEIEAIGTGGSGTQRALQMLYNCVQSTGDCAEASGFLRDDALFAGIIVSDNPDQSALTADAYVDYFATLKGDPDHVRIHAIAGSVPVPTCVTCASAGFGYDEAVELTLGQYVDICTNDWDGALTTLAEHSLGAYQPLMILGALPVVDSIVVEVDRVVTKSGWIYTGYPLAGGTNEIQFDSASLPVPGSTIEVRYSVAAVCE